MLQDRQHFDSPSQLSNRDGVQTIQSVVEYDTNRRVMPGTRLAHIRVLEKTKATLLHSLSGAIGVCLD